ncbi:MAG: protein-L-isoaspartate(D-aspartate) O-methyltransferase [Anaerolineaceae bacterium]|nr:MAG: protein-L-isoaspartate(D-aspartate) O-methyltransferase [Anaerolineaceae bacterium]
MTEDEYRAERKRMVTEQIARRGILDPRLLAVMESVPRHRFVPPDELAHAHADGPLSIGHGQTISQPYIVALMTELLQLTASARVLEVGAGSGYQAAVLAGLAAEVHTVEVIPELARRAEETLAALGYSNVRVHPGDGSLGWPEAAPYDGILVAAAAPEVPPPLLAQLAEGGRLVLPVGGRGFQQLEVWENNGGQFACGKNIAVAFVPLRGVHGWK